ncbi:MAG: IS66 family insertion sequence element accessory protein TnpB [Polyangiaceae bacterium]|nr:IS66 family insertion sequence element accessory protein TnpB [Polyangiaceae bacterium]
MRFGFERLGAWCASGCSASPRSRALFVFFGKRRVSVKVLSWDGTGVVLWYKKLDSGLFEIPMPARRGEQSVRVDEATFEAIFSGLRRTVH